MIHFDYQCAHMNYEYKCFSANRKKTAGFCILLLYNRIEIKIFFSHCINGKKNCFKMKPRFILKQQNPHFTFHFGT